MAVKLVSAFEVLVFITTFLFLFEFLTNHFCVVFGIN
jgi:hypothetical protein